MYILPEDHPLYPLLYQPITVLVDSREQRPVPFPASIVIEHPISRQPHTVIVRTAQCALPAGDYALRGHTQSCLIERKGSILELLKNFSDPVDALRQQTALRRLADSTRRPILLLECAHSDLYTIPPAVRAGRTEDECKNLLACNLTRLLRVLMAYRIPLWLTGAAYAYASRLQLGSTLATILLEAAIQDLSAQQPPHPVLEDAAAPVQPDPDELDERLDKNPFSTQSIIQQRRKLKNLKQRQRHRKKTANLSS